MPNGLNIFGSAITEAARKVDELKTHEVYVAWFKANFPAVFKLMEEDPTTLGARTASQAELPLPAAGRSHSDAA